EGVPNMAFLVATTVPTGTKALSAHQAQLEGKLAVNWTTASPFSFYANVGIASVKANGTQATKTWTSAALWFAVNPRISLFGEGLAAGRANGSSNVSVARHDVGGGITYLINDQLQIDGRYGLGLGASATHKYWGFGLAKRW